MVPLPYSNTTSSAASSPGSSMGAEYNHSSCAPSPTPPTPQFQNLPLPAVDWGTLANTPTVDIAECPLGDLNVAPFAVPNHVAGLELLAQAGKMALQQEQHHTTPLDDITNNNRQPSTNGVSPSSTPAYRAQPRRSERTLARWSDRTAGSSHVFSHAERRRHCEPTTSVRYNPSRPQARRSRNMRPRRVLHRMRAQEYLDLTPLPFDFPGYDALTSGQQMQVAYLFSLQDNIKPWEILEEGTLPWQYTVIREWEYALATDWEHPCQICGLVSGPWCIDE